MPEPDRSVIEEDPASSKDSDSNSPGGDNGRVSKDLEKEIRANLKAEMDRHMKKEVESVKKALESEYADRIAELERKSNLSRSEDAELQKLTELKTHPDSKVWKSFIAESVKDIIGETEKKYSKQEYEDALEMVDEWAEIEKIETEKFKEEINAFLPRVRNDKNINRPIKLVRAAYKEWKLEREKDKELKELREKQKTFLETGRNRVPRKPDMDDIRKRAKETGNWSEVLARQFDKPKK